MMNRILVAIDDSRPAMAAGAYALLLAEEQGALLHLVAVSEPAHTSHQALRHIADLAARKGLTTTQTSRAGRTPFEVILAVAEDWKADLIVMGLADGPRPGVPHVGSQTEHLLEFTHIPVLVVPNTTDAS